MDRFGAAMRPNTVTKPIDPTEGLKEPFRRAAGIVLRRYKADRPDGGIERLTAAHPWPAVALLQSRSTRRRD